MAGWLHGAFVGDWLFVFPLCGFSLSLFCNYESACTPSAQLRFRNVCVVTVFSRMDLNESMPVFMFPAYSHAPYGDVAHLSHLPERHLRVDFQTGVYT